MRILIDGILLEVVNVRRREKLDVGEPLDRSDHFGSRPKCLAGISYLPFSPPEPKLQDPNFFSSLTNPQFTSLAVLSILTIQ